MSEKFWPTTFWGWVREVLISLYVLTILGGLAVLAWRAAVPAND